MDWGPLSAKDQQRVKKLFELIDADKDGIISFQEVRTANGGDPDGRMKQMFTKLDRNKDGQASLEEWVKFWVALHKAKGTRPFTKFLKALATSAMQHNAPAPSEVSGQPPDLPAGVVALATELFGMMDLDANGNVSNTEFSDAHGDSSGMWNVLDSNKDGVLSLKELLAVLGAMKAKKGQDCVEFYVKHMIVVIKSNQADNPKVPLHAAAARPLHAAATATAQPLLRPSHAPPPARPLHVAAAARPLARGAVSASRGNHVFSDRSSRIEQVEAKLRATDAELMDSIVAQKGGDNVTNYAKEFGPDLLLASCWRGDASAVEELLMMEVEPNARDSGGFDAMMYSVLAAHTASMKALYKADTDKKLDFSHQDESGATSIMIAACEGNMTAGGALAAWCGNDAPRVINLVNAQGNSALHFAAMNGSPSFVAFLLNPLYKCDISLRNNDGKDAIALATENGHTETAVLLQEEIDAPR